MSFQRFCREKITRISLSLWNARRRPSLVLRRRYYMSQSPLHIKHVHGYQPSTPVKPLVRFFTTVTTSDDEYKPYRQPSNGVMDLIQFENNRTRECIPQHLTKEIQQEILQAYNSSTEGNVPEMGPTGEYLYFVKHDANGGTCQYTRRHVTTGKEQHVLDVNFHDYQLVAMSLSVEETFIAYLLSPVKLPGETRVQIRSLNSVGCNNEFVLHLPSDMTTTITNVEWGPIQSNASNSLFLTTTNNSGHPSAVYACCINSATGRQVTPFTKIYSNNEHAVMVDVQRLKGCQHVAIYASTKTSSEIHLIGNINESRILVRQRQEGVLYHVDIGEEEDVFLLVHAAEAQHESGLSEEMALFETNVSCLPLTTGSFGKRISNNGEDGESVIADMEVFETFIALYERSTVDGCHQIRIIHRNGNDYVEDRIVPLPRERSGECALLSSGGNMHYGSTSLEFSVSSPCCPPRTYSYDTIDDTVHVLGDDKEPVHSYVEKRVFATSKDGTRVPMSILSAKQVADNVLQSKRLARPTVLIGYGSYGEDVVQGFDPTMIPLLERGFVVAYAHTRGGGELGRAWYRAGRLYDKKRAIEDYIACAETLVGSLAITEPCLLAAKGFSAGGVIVAGAVNERPDLFGSLVLTNAFLDVTTTMTTDTDWMTEHEYSEWGNVLHDKDAAAAVSSYCPMTNVSPQEYPPMLLIGTVDDLNVPYWHALTFCLKIRKALEEGGFDSQRVLLHVEASGGHQLHGPKLDVASMEAALMIEMCRGRTVE